MAPVLIARSDVFRNPGRQRGPYPLVVVLQADAISHTGTVVVAPLVPDDAVSSSRLTPSFVIEGRTWTLIVTDLASIPRRSLKDRVTSLAAEHDRITAALDLLFLGF
jgi:toxin CcdB